MTSKGDGLNQTDSVNERLLRERIIVLFSVVEENIANQICAQLLQLEAEDPDQDIRLYIMSPGGSVTAGMAIYDTMQFIKPDVATYAMGMAAGMGQFLLSAGTRGKRYALSAARILLRGPTVGVSGTAADVQIQADMLSRLRRELAALIAEHTGQSFERILLDWDGDRWFSAEEALEYGFVDHVLRDPGRQDVLPLR